MHSAVGLFALSSAGRHTSHGLWPYHTPFHEHPLVPSPCPAGVRQSPAPTYMSPVAVSPVPSGLEVSGWLHFIPKSPPFAHFLV